MTLVDYDFIQKLEKTSAESDLKHSKNIRDMILHHLTTDLSSTVMCIPKGYVLRRGISKQQFKDWVELIRASGVEVIHDYYDDSFIFKPNNNI